jgi:hypothetical protein
MAIVRECESHFNFNSKLTKEFQLLANDWKRNTGKMPVGSHNEVELIFKDGGGLNIEAGQVNWRLGIRNEIEYWREVKQVESLSKTVDDIEEGMFLKCENTIWFCKGFNCSGKLLCLPANLDPICTGTVPFTKEAFCEDSWSYTYNGIYKPFVKKETEEQRKIRELEETINKAKQQIQELKGK